MPRQARIDAVGAVHHIIARGIERCKIFRGARDRLDFLDRLGKIITATATDCFAWALMPNHFHLLLRTGKAPIATVMRRLLTGHAVSFNLRHKRCGHLFQNRYKSILCQEDTYLKELVRYIHLNPLRSKIVKSLTELDHYRFCGHGVILGAHESHWQQVDQVLHRFGADEAAARGAYRSFIEAGINQGRREDLIGGGLVRSSGGWTRVKSMRMAGQFLKSDERILGDSDFVEKVLREAHEAIQRKCQLRSQGVSVEQLIRIAAKMVSIPPDMVMGPGKERRRVKARRLVSYWGVRELGLTSTMIANRLGIALPTVSKAVQQGEEIIRREQLSLFELLNI